MDVALIARGLIVWICLVSALIVFALRSAPAALLTFYRIGPHEGLVIMGIVIDDYARYAAVVLYCAVNSVFRSFETDVLHAWLINSVQNESAPKTQEVRRIAYTVAVIHSVYYWWDWFLYMNILLAQVDLFLIETVSSVLMSILTTRAYLQHDGSYAIL